MAALTFYYENMNDPVSQSLMLLLAANDIPHETVETSDGRDTVTEICNGKWRADNYLSALQFLESEANFGTDPAEKEQQMKVLKYWVENIQPLFYRSVVTKNPREGVDLFFEALSYLENSLLTSPGPYFGGKHPSNLDYGLYPWLEKIGCWIPVDKHDCVGIQSWIRRMTKDPVVSMFMPDCDMAAFKTYKEALSKKMAGFV